MQNRSHNPLKLKFWTQESSHTGLDEESNLIIFDGVMSRFSQKKGSFVDCRIKIKGNKLFYIKVFVFYLGFLGILFLFPRIAGQSNPYKAKITLNDQDLHTRKTFYQRTLDQNHLLIKQLTKFCIMQDFDENFETVKLIGKGGTCKVYLVKNRLTKMLYAAKMISYEDINKKASSDRLKAAIHEVNMLKSLKCYKLPSLNSVYNANNNIIIVQEYIKGGTLLQKLSKRKILYETETAKIIESLLHILVYLEEHQIVHRDIKLENILFAKGNFDDDDEELYNHLKLIDFGLAIKINEIDIKQVCGTPGTIAPEILSMDSYTTKADIFSLGVLAYILLSGTKPFKGTTSYEIIAENHQCKIDFTSSIWLNISIEAKNFVIHTMARDPNNRYNAKQALNSDWIKGYSGFCTPITTIEESCRGEIRRVDSIFPFNIQPINQSIRKLMDSEQRSKGEDEMKEDEWTVFATTLSNIIHIMMKNYVTGPLKNPFQVGLQQWQQIEFQRFACVNAIFLFIILFLNLFLLFNFIFFGLQYHIRTQ